jgi:hypothetical protein
LLINKGNERAGRFDSSLELKELARLVWEGNCDKTKPHIKAQNVIKLQKQEEQKHAKQRINSV